MSKILIHPLYSRIWTALPGQTVKTWRKIISATGLFFLGTLIILLDQAIAPRIAQASIARIDLTLERLPEESYENILHRAEAVARATAQRSFDKDILVTEVSVIVNAENMGEVAPILSLEVTRDKWKQLPDPHRWATYFRTAKSLLFWQSDTITPSAPAVSSVPNKATNSATSAKTSSSSTDDHVVSPNNGEKRQSLPVIPPNENPPGKQPG